jgi:ferredoxin-NADP reductase/nitrite reductase/ring-hydroxylating ferredoxin subunit
MNNQIDQFINFKSVRHFLFKIQIIEARKRMAYRVRIISVLTYIMNIRLLASEEFVKVANTNDIQPSRMRAIQVNGLEVCIANVDGKYYAINNICTHEGGPLADGRIVGYEIECPWHSSKFDVRTGQVIQPPASEPEPVYEVKVEGNSILVRKTSDSSSTQVVREQEQKPQLDLTLIEKQKVEGTDVMSFKFDKSSLQYMAGQYAYFDIGGVHNDPKGPIRHFTIASSPTEDFILMTTRIRDSPYKKRLVALEVGVKVKVKGPEGKFILHEDHSKPAIFLLGGIGVTPFRSMIKYATDKQLPLKIIMFDSNRNKQNILFKDEFDECLRVDKNLKIIYTISDKQDQSGTESWKGEKGRIDKAMLTKHLQNDELLNSIFYICGPPAMINSMQVLLKELQIQKDQIRVEEFTGY